MILEAPLKVIVDEIRPGLGGDPGDENQSGKKPVLGVPGDKIPVGSCGQKPECNRGEGQAEGQRAQSDKETTQELNDRQGDTP